MEIYFGNPFLHLLLSTQDDGEQKKEKTKKVDGKKDKNFLWLFIACAQTTERKYADPLHVLVSRASSFSHCSVIPKVDNEYGTIFH